VFKEDPKFLQNEEKYAEIKEEILGGDSDDESGSEAGSDEEDEDEDGRLLPSQKYLRIAMLILASTVAPEKEGIQDMTETDLVNLRRSIYLTLMNSLGFEEAVHKLMNISVPEGKEVCRTIEKRIVRGRSSIVNRLK
jgi:pre-mRNA-splicing factor CWC22